MKCGLHGFGWPLIVLGLLLLWLRYVGIPQPIVKRVQSELSSRGIQASVDHMYYSLLRGLSIKGLQVDIPATDVPLAIQVDDARILWTPFEISSPNRGLKGLEIRSGRGVLDMTRYAGSEDRIVEWTFDALSGHLDLSDRGVHVRELSGHTFGFDVKLTGDMLFGRNYEWHMPQARGQEVDARSGLKPLMQALEILQGVQYQRPPELGISFYWQSSDLSRNEMTVELLSENELVLRGVTFERMAFKGSLQSNTIEVTAGEIIHREGAVSVDGHYYTALDELDAEVHSSMPPHLLRALLPVEWLAPLSDSGLLEVSSLDVEVEFPRNPRDQLSQEWSGALRTQGLNYRGLWVDSLSMKVQREAGQLLFTELDGQLGSGKGKGPLAGEVHYDIPSGRYAATLNTGFHPAVVLPICPPALNSFLSRFSMNREGPTCKMDFSGQVGVKNSLTYRGEFEGQNFSYNEAFMASLNTVGTFSNRVVRLDPFVVNRSEGALNGSIQLDFNQKHAELNLVSFINPAVLASVIHPRVEELLRPFDFKGDSFLRLDGVYDYGENVEHDLQGTMYVEQAGPDRLLLEDCYFHLNFVSNIFSMADMKGTIENGPVTGFVQVDGLDSPTNKNFFINLQVTDSDLKAIVQRNFALEDNPYSGFLSTHISVGGRVSTNWPSTISGKGRLSIRDGELFKMPLLGGLSRYLSKMFHGFGYASQGDFLCTFLIENEALSTKDAELQGNILSATAKGALGFDKHLDFKVQVRPLKSGVVADVFRLVLSPITKLFEFKLGGNLSEPTWRPDNLPKELFLQFD